MPDNVRPQVLYNISGEARAEFKILDLRDRIRNGTLNPQDQIAIVGTDLWKPASDFPELTRYFSLVKPAATPGLAAPSAKPQTPAASLGSRIVPGLAYPFTDITSIIVIVAVALLRAATPLLSIIFSMLASVYALGVIRKSSEGQTSAPSAGEVGNIGEWIMSFVRVIAVSLISAWPILAVTILAFMGLVRSPAIFGIALLVMLLYYPASLATIAIWKSIKIALSVQQIFRFIGILGIEYYAVIGMWFVIVFGIAFGMSLIHLALGSTRLFAVIEIAVQTWSTLYASHLLGWAVYRHRDQL